MSRIGAAIVLAALALATACSGSEQGSSTQGPTESVPVTATGPELVPTLEELTDPVAATRRAILDAAGAGDYDALEAVVDPAVFLSDAGFGVNPVPYWRGLGGAVPLETMEGLLNMSSTVEDTNEGTLYQWPRFTEESSPEDMPPKERQALVALLGEDGLRNSFQEETGYIAPRLGILDDGTWWFLVLEAAP